MGVLSKMVGTVGTLVTTNKINSLQDRSVVTVPTSYIGTRNMRAALPLSMIGDSSLAHSPSC